MSAEIAARLKQLDTFKGMPDDRLALFAAQLRKANLFASLSDAEMIEIVSSARLIHRDRGDVIIREGDTDKVFYFILKGQLRVWKKDGDQKRLLNYHEASDFVGELIFLSNRPRAGTVDVVDDADLLCFDPKGFEMIAHHEQIDQYLRTWSHARILHSNREFRGKHWDEIAVVLAHKSWVALARQIIVPIAVALIVVAIMVMLWIFTHLLTEIMVSVVASVLIFMGLWAFWMFEDWRNDEFIVTSKRIIHIERFLVPPFPVERHEAPIEQVQNIVSRNHGLWTVLFDVHTLEIKTSGAGTILFPYLSDSKAIADAIFHSRDLAKTRMTVETSSRIRQTLLKELGQQVKTVSPLPSGETLDITPERKGLLGLIDYFTPRMRIVKRDQIIWRKHWLVLVKEVGLPALSTLGSFVLLILAIALYPDLWYLAMILPLALLATSFSWYIWRYDGWRNDIYIVTDSRIVDIEGSPFHLRKESRSEGTFDIIQNTEYSSPNWLARVLRIGDVKISTAAKAGAFTFNSVARPEEVQQEIFKRLAAFRDRKAQAESERQHAELGRWFGAYHGIVSTDKE